MFESALNSFRDMLDARRGAQDAYDQAVKDAGAKFKGDYLTDRLAELKAARAAVASEATDICRAEVSAAFANARTRVNAAASRPIDPSMLATITAYEGLNLGDAEKAAIASMVKDSYAARRRAVEVLGIDDSDMPPSLDDVTESLDWLETLVTGAIDKPSNAYYPRLVAHGAVFDSVEAKVSIFVSAYGSDA